METVFMSSENPDSDGLKKATKMLSLVLKWEIVTFEQCDHICQI